MMKDTERRAKEVLINLGFCDDEIEYEPRGRSTTPDFLIKGKIAVEVRRLNQNHKNSSNSSLKGLEEIRCPLFGLMKTLCGQSGPPDGNSWFVHICINRPLPKTIKPIKNALSKKLEEFKNGKNKTQTEEIPVKISFSRSTKKFDTFFVFGSATDRQAGGWIKCEFHTNLRHCIEEKGKKILSYRNYYQKWWLVLEDRIGMADEQVDPSYLDGMKLEVWDRIILFDPENRQKFLDVPLNDLT